MTGLNEVTLTRDARSDLPSLNLFPFSYIFHTALWLSKVSLCTYRAKKLRDPLVLMESFSTTYTLSKEPRIVTHKKSPYQMAVSCSTKQHDPLIKGQVEQVEFYLGSLEQLEYRKF